MFFFIATACSFNFSRSVIHDTCSSRKKIELAFDVINWSHPVGSNLFCYRKKELNTAKVNTVIQLRFLQLLTFAIFKTYRLSINYRTVALYKME
jgi:hypothetical protein